MEIEGYVSMWISDEAGAAKVQRAVKIEYTEDGDWIAPPFAEAFGFARFNPSTREAHTLTTPTTSLRDAVSGFSYDAVLGERFAHEIGESLPTIAVSIALLYDFKFSGSPSTAVIDGATWTYVGCVRYR